VIDKIINLFIPITPFNINIVLKCIERIFIYYFVLNWTKQNDDFAYTVQVILHRLYASRKVALYPHIVYGLFNQSALNITTTKLITSGVKNTLSSSFFPFKIINCVPKIFTCLIDCFTAHQHRKAISAKKLC